MTRARMPRPHEVAAARRDPRLLRAMAERRLDEAWRTRGVCQSVDPETFFPAPSEPPDAAVALCRTCQVQGPCLAWALDAGDSHGVWGATTPRERRAMLVAWQGSADPDDADPGEADPGDAGPDGTGFDGTGPHHAGPGGADPGDAGVDVEPVHERLLSLVPLR